ncbi:MAG: hypothetical protein ACJ76H_05370 [Bacteriovoracaceae bacterium]
MHFRTFIICVLLISSTLAWGVDRKPAVEDFVGIEVDHPETTPQGTDSLVNLEKDIQTIHAEAYTSVKSSPKKTEFSSSSVELPWSMTNIVSVFMIMALPLFIWFVVMNRLRKKASVESASNVEVLEKYRRDREQARKREESERKAS